MKKNTTNIIKEFNTKKVEFELSKINKILGIKTKAPIQLIVNSMLLYNEIIHLYKNGDTKKVYLIYQLNGQIFKQLKEFRILPSSIIKHGEPITDLNNDGF